jgi:citrate lyase subunit beta/citryl-CoA lyase
MATAPKSEILNMADLVAYTERARAGDGAAVGHDGNAHGDPQCAHDAATAVYKDNRLSCLVMGTNDLIKESRARALHDRFAVVPWLAMTLVASRAYKLDILDGVYNDIRDEAGLREECEKGRILGMDGKTLIHPSQVGPCNEIFSPTQEEVDWSRKIIDAFGQPENEKKGVIVVDGHMVERLHFGMAQRTVDIADRIREMEKSLAQD